MNVVILVFLILAIFSKNKAKIIEFVCGILHKCHYKKEETIQRKVF